MPKNYAFIDGQNVHLAIRDQGWVLDWQRFRRYLQDKYDVEKAFICIGYLKGNEYLYAALRQAGYNLIFKPTLELHDGTRTVTKGNVDAELVLHTMIEWNNYEKALIVSGDGDFHCLVKHLLSNRKLLCLMIPHAGKYSALLRVFRRHIVYMNNLRKKLGKHL